MRGARARAAIAPAALLAWLCVAGPASAAGNVDAIADGGFEATTCSQVPNEWGVEVPDCQNPDWERSGTQAMPCHQPDCRPGGARTGQAYAILGGQGTDVDPYESGALAQTVTLPSDGPKLLRFSLKGIDDAPGPVPQLEETGSTVGNFAVAVDGNYLFTSTAADAPESYETQSVDLRGYSGEHTISFSTSCERLLPPKQSWIVPCDEFDVDDVSLMVTPDPAAAVETTFARTPARTTSSRHARFGFQSDAEGARFQCSVDKGEFAACSSPLTLRVDRGRHRFRVRAVAGGTVDKTPAAWKWRVKRHR